MDIKESRQDLKNLHNQYLTTMQEWLNLAKMRGELSWDDPQRIILEAEMKEQEQREKVITARLEELQARVDEHESLYLRPDGRVTKWFSRVLGPLPKGMKCFKLSDEVISDMPKYRFLPLALLAGVVVFVVTAVTYMPWLAVSPFTLMASSVSVGESGQSTVIHVIVGIIVVAVFGLILANRRSANRTVHELALEEEQWFRAGSESWTLGQRTTSCLSFGACHVINVIYPLVTIVALVLVGAVFMLVYLSEFRRSQDGHRALLASTHFHAMYNSYAFWLLFCGMMFWLISSVF